MTIYGDEDDKIKEYNNVLKEFFSNLIYYISSFDNSINRYILLKEIYYIVFNINKYPPVEYESQIIIIDDSISFSIIEWDGYYYENTDINNTSIYEYYPDKKTYYKINRDINNFIIEVSREDKTKIFTINKNGIELEIKDNQKKTTRILS